MCSSQKGLPGKAQGTSAWEVVLDIPLQTTSIHSQSSLSLFGVTQPYKHPGKKRGVSNSALNSHPAIIQTNLPVEQTLGLGMSRVELRKALQDVPFVLYCGFN